MATVVFITKNYFSIFTFIFHKNSFIAEMLHWAVSLANMVWLQVFLILNIWGLTVLVKDIT